MEKTNKTRLIFWKNKKEKVETDAIVFDDGDELIIALPDAFVEENHLSNKQIKITEVRFEDE